MSITALKREVTKLRDTIGGAQSALSLHPAFRLHGPDGTPEDGLCGLTGEPIEPTENTVIFDVVAAPFRLLAEGARHTALPHGRGAGISSAVGRYVLGLMLVHPHRVLCVREVQLSLKHSVFSLLADLIHADARLEDFFTIFEGEDGTIGKNGSQCLFRGVRTSTAAAIRSLEDVRFVWAEEGQSLSGTSIETITFTNRVEGARVFWSWNRTKAKEPISAAFWDVDRPDLAKPEQPFTVLENPFASETLRQEAELLRQRDPERYQHVVIGGVETRSERRIFNNWLVQPVDIAEVIRQRKDAIKAGHAGTLAQRRARRAAQCRRIDNDFGVGLDFGTVDPFTIVLTYFDETFGRLFILHEYYKTGLDPDGMLAALRDFPLPTPKWPVYADHRPELIAYLSKHGVNAHPAVKLPVVDRIHRLQQLDIIVDAKCERAIEELGLYSWATDAQGVIIPDRPEDTNNHLIDAIAYSLGNRALTRPEIGYSKLSNPWTAA